MCDNPLLLCLLELDLAKEQRPNVVAEAVRVECTAECVTRIDACGQRAVDRFVELVQLVWQVCQLCRPPVK